MIDIEQIKVELEEAMEQTIAGLKQQLTKVQTGRASATALDGVSVDYYGNRTPISQVGQISIPEARLLQIRPFDKSMIAEIEKAILGANLGLTPGNDGNLIRIPFPPLTEERRKDRVKEIKKYGEDAKVALRGYRRDKNEVLKKAEKDKHLSEDESKKYQREIQEITDKFTSSVDNIIESKEQEVLSLS